LRNRRDDRCRTEGELAAEQVGERRRAALVRHVRELGTRCEREQLSGKMVAAADPVEP